MTKLPDYSLLLQVCEDLDADRRGQIEELFFLYGIAKEYIEFSGNIAQIPFSDRLDILLFRGVDLFSEAHIDSTKLNTALANAQQEVFKFVLAPVTVLTIGTQATVLLYLPSAALECAWEWTLRCEDGSVFNGDFYPHCLQQTGQKEFNEQIYSARELEIPELTNAAVSIGYHQLHLQCLDSSVSAQHGLGSLNASVIVAPSRAYEPDWSLAGCRLWGFSVQLYTLRSARNWGMGDFSDLAELVRCASAKQASFLALNPLHALNIDSPEQCSPYSPNDRRRLNILYVDQESVPEYTDAAAVQLLVESRQWQQRLKALRNNDRIDYPKVAQCKREVFALMFEHFVNEHILKNSMRALEFTAFVHEQQPDFLEFAEFEAARLRTQNASKVESDPRYTLYTQWLAELQLAACQQLAMQCGMRIGLIRDLAVGGDGSGAEIKLQSNLYCELASIGAPPDPLAPQGQNWGLPPLDPHALRFDAYRHFIRLLQTNMAHCGALRIDHVMALMRLWWSPRYAGRGVGAYVHYNADELFAILRLESIRNKCVVIGEDLGIVPPEVRTYIRDSAVFSNALFYFEKYDSWHFKKPEHYNPKALTMIANHDVPTLAAWWNGFDLKLRYELQLIGSESELQEQLHQRREEKGQILYCLGEQWLLPTQWQGDSVDHPFDSTLCAAIIRCCARSASQLISVQLDDLALLETPVNIPGTSNEYPNWSRRLPTDVGALIGSELGEKLLSGFSQERGLS